MVQELIYTSAPRGLKPGSRGFCTVASTQGMASSLTEKLESLSGYRHVYSAQDPNAHLNPVVLSHLRITVGGTQYHVLSRVCAAGLDYSQRSNKLAHHVVLDAVELPPAGPAWLLAPERQLMRIAWDGPPRVLTAAPGVPTGDFAAAVCRTWEQATGDAGWGGWLAETVASGRGKQMFLVFRPGMNVLSLLAESIALLPPARRWDATFSTYHTTLPAGLDCQWRCVLEGSPEAVAARRTPQNVVLDLCRASGSAPDGPYVAMARTGIRPPSLSEGVPPRLPGGALPEGGVESSPGAPIGTRPESQGVFGYVPPPGSALGQYGTMPPVPATGVSAAGRPVRRKPKRNRSLALRLSILVAAILLLVTGGLGILLWKSGYLEVAHQKSAGEGGNARQKSTKKEPGDSKARSEKTAPTPGGGRSPPATKAKPPAPDDASKKQAEQAAKERADKVRQEDVERAKRAAEKARLDRLENAMNGLPSEIDLPVLEYEMPPNVSLVGKAAAKQSERDPPRPAIISPLIYTEVGDRLQLKVLGNATALGGKITFKLGTPKAQSGTDATSRTWDCLMVRTRRAGSPEADPGAAVGQFVMDTRGFIFRWSDELKNNRGRVKEANQLRNWILCVSAPELKRLRFISLRKPIDIDPKKLDPESHQEEFVALGEKDSVNLPEDESLLRVRWEFAGLPKGVQAVRWTRGGGGEKPATDAGRQALFLIGKDLPSTGEVDTAKLPEVIQVDLRWANRSTVGFTAKCTGKGNKSFKITLGLLKNSIDELAEVNRTLASETGQAALAVDACHRAAASLRSAIAETKKGIASITAAGTVLSPDTEKELRKMKGDLRGSENQLSAKLRELEDKKLKLAGRQKELRDCNVELERLRALHNVYCVFRDDARVCVEVAAVVKGEDGKVLKDDDGSEHEVVIIRTKDPAKKPPGGPAFKADPKGKPGR